MASQTTHPTKEQVRAYMAAREAARRPPPPPEEIRRQLGWRLVPEDEQSLVRFCMIPSTYAQLVARLALQWLFPSARHTSLPPDCK
jgi:hypothetical protein